MWRSIALFLLLSFVFTSCASSRAFQKDDAVFTLYVDAQPQDSLIYIDDVLYGTVKTLLKEPLRIEAGTKRVLIECAGYHSFRTSLEYIQPGEVYTLKTRLIKSDF
ncbi:MAG: PEGA domain-containing protein [Bradymonadales bacterium]